MDVVDHKTEIWTSERWILLYLGLPAFIFLGAWLKPLWAVVSLFFLVVSMTKAWQLLSRKVTKLEVKAQIFLLLAAFLATFLSGIGGFFYQNSDHEKHNAMLFDLTAKDWPVQYEQADNRPLIYSVGYYLPAALAGKVFGSIEVSRWVLFAWTVLGLFFVFNLLGENLAIHYSLLPLTFLLFGGADIFGTFLFADTKFWWGAHIEWWATIFQYSSHGTQVLWVPQHCLPAWLLTALIWFNREDKNLWIIAPLILFFAGLWSAFVSMGLGFVFLVLFLYSKPTFQGRWWSVQICLLFVLFFFYRSGSQDIPVEFLFSTYPFSKYWMHYVAILCLEILPFGVWTALSRTKNLDKKAVWLGVAICSCVPLVLVGAAHDLAMRTSIPFLIIFYICLANGYQSPAWFKKKIVYSCFIVYMLIGAVTSFSEFYRPFVLGRSVYPFNQSLPEIRFGDQYIGKKSSFFYRRLGDYKKDTPKLP